MGSSSESYDDVARVYIQLIRKVSDEVAEDIEKIYALCGAHAALRAALVITLFKIEALQNEWVPGIRIYAHLLEEYPEALVYQVHAMAVCMQTWGVAVVTTDDWKRRETVPTAPR